MAKNHPYLGKPDYQFWAREPAIVDRAGFDPINQVSFSLTPDEPIVTAGSCFAQHVAKQLQKVGFNYLVTEKPHPIIPSDIAQEFHYGAFTARYGNLYTARQLRQLLERAYGLFEPQESAWAGKMGRLVDPFRPQIQPGGFLNEAELEADRSRHLAAVREAVETLSCFIFTLGLTEGWIDTRDGTVFPLAPGVAGGLFDAERYAFKNFSVAEVTEDLQWSLDFIRAKRPEAKFIITVSPVPLNATYLDRHVFVSTTYSKSVLRVAAEEVTQATPLCDYFPSYEIVNNPYHAKTFFAKDRREVTPSGVAYVMGLFLKHYANITPEESRPNRHRRAAQARAQASGATAPVERVSLTHGLLDRETRTAERPGKTDKASLRREAKRRRAASNEPGKRAGKKSGQDNYLKEMERLNDILCDEESIDNR